MRAPALLLAIAVIVTACVADPDLSPTPTRQAADPAATPAIEPWPHPPAVPDGPLDRSVEEALDRLLATILDGAHDAEALDTVAASGDARLAWLLSDMLRLVPADLRQRALVEAFAELTGTDPRGDDRFGPVPWLAVTNLLIGWDLPEPPGYRQRKATLFLAVEPRWEPFFADAASDIDWRVTSWGGVFIDHRAIGDEQPCDRPCIPALDDPALTPAADGDWYDDERTVFGITVGGEAIALPKNIMEVHEMVNLTIGDRRIGLPYCTLCGSAQAYFTDAVPDGVDTVVLRTSGLLARSNKVMYDLVTDSAFDTFTGRAISGPLREINFTLEQTSVVVSTWGEWKAAHPDTRIVAADGGIGRSYPDDPLGGRDDDGPIFPIGPADQRLPMQSSVVGVTTPDGEPLAFAADLARAALAAGATVEMDGVGLVADGSGFRAVDHRGQELPSHEAFWFAWSQFHPGTGLWAPVPLERSSPQPAT